MNKLLLTYRAVQFIFFAMLYRSYLRCLCMGCQLSIQFHSSCASGKPLIQSKMSRRLVMTKPTKWPVRPAKTQISLGIRPVWSEYSLCAQWVAKDLSFLHADSEHSDQTGRMPRLIWVFAGRICHFVGFVTMRLKLSIKQTMVISNLEPFCWYISKATCTKWIINVVL